MARFLIIASFCASIVISSTSRSNDAAKTLRSSAIDRAQAGDCKGAIKFYKELLKLLDGHVQDDFNNLGVCLQQEAQYEEALEVYNDGLERYYHSEKLHYNKGVLLEEWAAKEAISRKYEWTKEIDDRSYNSTQHLTFALRLKLGALHEKHAHRIPAQNRIGLGKLTVAIFCHRRDDAPEGSPDAPIFGTRAQDIDGLQPAGHDEAIPFLARHLARPLPNRLLPLSPARPHRRPAPPHSRRAAPRTHDRGRPGWGGAGR
jgi:tetratricopeptide (TPR) repeat protein